MQDVPRLELTHPIVRGEVPARSRIRDRIDREGLIIVAMENYHLLVRRGFVGRIQLPLVSLGRARLHEGSNLDVSRSSQDELTRVWIEFVNEPAVVFLPRRHSREERRSRVVLAAHESVAVVERDRGIAFHNRPEILRRGDYGKDRLAGVLVEARRQIRAFAVERHVDVIEHRLARSRGWRVARVVSRGVILLTVNGAQSQVMACQPNVFAGVATRPNPLRDVGKGRCDL